MKQMLSQRLAIRLLCPHLSRYFKDTYPVIIWTLIRLFAVIIYTLSDYFKDTCALIASRLSPYFNGTYPVVISALIHVISKSFIQSLWLHLSRYLNDIYLVTMSTLFQGHFPSHLFPYNVISITLIRLYYCNLRFALFLYVYGFIKSLFWPYRSIFF